MEKELQERLVKAFENIAKEMGKTNSMLNSALSAPMGLDGDRLFQILLTSNGEHHIDANVSGSIINEVGIHEASNALDINISGDLDISKE